MIQADTGTVGSLPPLEVPASFEASHTLSPQTVFSLVTIYPGEALYSAFGHTAIRINDPATGMDLLYNYGQSSVPFDSGFVPDFVRGYLPFMLGVIDTERAYRFYIEVEDRSIYEQRLGLSYPDKLRLYRFLAYNALAENRIYIYDFFFDNCTTRVRDLFTYLYSESLVYELPERQKTFRQEIAPYFSPVPYISLGIDLLFGMPSDRRPEARQRLYLPFQLMKAIEGAVRAPRSGNAGLETATRIIYLQERENPKPPPIAPALPLWVLFAAAALLTYAGRRSTGKTRGSVQTGDGRIIRTGTRLFDSLLFLFGGILGSTMLLLWTSSGYLMTTGNLNLIWAWPLHLIAAVLIAAGCAGGSVGAARTGKDEGLRRNHDPRLGRILRLYLFLSAAVSALFVLSIPLLPQTIPSAAVPLILSLALRGGDRGLGLGFGIVHSRKTVEESGPK